MVNKSIIAKASTALNLGLTNLARVVTYRLGVKSGINPVTRLEEILPFGNFFTDPESPADKGLSQPANLKAFGYIPYYLEGGKPNWFYSPLTKKVFKDIDTVWYKISDFDNSVGDIKGIWEASRFDWLIKLVEHERQHKDGKALITLDNWLNDWCEKNPAYLGPNWKCGQEASIRVMHIITALVGLNNINNINNNVLILLEIHLKRIAPTLSYAIAQDNNHGTSEAVALYIGGALLNQNKPHKQYLAWQTLGEKWLIDRAKKLIMPDGGFSQYSINYHRLMLDSYCLAEVVRRKLHLKPFPKQVTKKLIKATDWLYILVQRDGDVPNLGANDGAKLLPIGDTGYREFRPTVQLASTLFCKYSYYNHNESLNTNLIFFDIKTIIKNDKLPNKSHFFKNFGLITKESDDFFISFKFPNYKFRPGQSDALHLDVWLKGKNILRDGGSFSYNTNPENIDYFSGVKSHNTIEFDDHLQMPRLSRFLLGSWLKPINLKYYRNYFSCGYKDNWKCKHTRTVKTSQKKIEVLDRIEGFKSHAILRWRLIPGNWVLEGNTVSNNEVSLEITADTEVDIRLVEGVESRYYYQKQVLPVIEATVKKPTQLTTLIKDIT